MIWFNESETKTHDENEYGRLKRSKAEYSRPIECLFGVILGLAIYSDVLVNIPILPHIYKLLKTAKVYNINLLLISF